MCWAAGTQPSTWRREKPCGVCSESQPQLKMNALADLFPSCSAPGSLKLLPLKHSPATWPALLPFCPPRGGDALEDTEAGLPPITLCPKCHTSRVRLRSCHPASLQCPPWARHPTGARRWTGMCLYSPALREAAAWWRRWTMDHT